MRRDEWFLIDEIIEVFIAFRDGRPFPEKVLWRDVTSELQQYGVSPP